MLVFLGGAGVASYGGECFGSFEGSKASADLLSYFVHADVLFCLVVGEWYLEVVHEGEGFLFVFL